MEQSFGEKMVDLKPRGVDPFHVHAQKKAFATTLDTLHRNLTRAQESEDHDTVKRIETAIEEFMSTVRVVLRK